MYAQLEKPKENKKRAVANCIAQKKNNMTHGKGKVDNRYESPAQRPKSNLTTSIPGVCQLTDKDDLKSKLVLKGVADNVAQELVDRTQDYKELLEIANWGENHAIERHMSALTDDQLDARKTKPGTVAKDVAGEEAPLGDDGISSRFVTDVSQTTTLKSAVSNLNAKSNTQFNEILGVIVQHGGDLTAYRDEPTSEFTKLEVNRMSGDVESRVKAKVTSFGNGKEQLWGWLNMAKAQGTLRVRTKEHYVVKQSFPNVIGTGRKTKDNPITSIDLNGTETYMDIKAGEREEMIVWDKGKSLATQHADTTGLDKMDKNNLVLKTHFPNQNLENSVRSK